MMIVMNQHALFQTTVRCKISEAQIKKYSRDSQVRQLKDERYSLYLRFKQNRIQGAWFFMEYKSGKQKSHRLGQYPNLSAVHAFTVLQNLVADLSTGNRSSTNEFQTIDELLIWNLDREIRSEQLSKERLVMLKSITEGHLIPNLHGTSINGLQHRDIESLLMKSLRERHYSISYMRVIFQALKTSFNKALKLRLLTYNPLNNMKFTDFVSTPIDVKGCKVRPSDVPNILEQIQNSDPFARILSLLMLTHGTRIGETRKAKWRHICFKTKRWTIPKHNTKTKKEMIYPLSNEMVLLLQSFKQWQLDHYYQGNNVFPNSKYDKAPIHRGTASDFVKSVSKGEWTAHDLRKLARTVWADIGIDYLVAETLLNHAKGKLDQAYIHTHIEFQKSEALNRYHLWLKKSCCNCLSPVFQK